MNSKSIISLVLLLFVGVTMIYLVVSETGTPESEDMTAASGVPSGVAALSGRVVTVTYFHGNTRCATCNKLESYSLNTIHIRFAEQLEAGGLIWQTINYEDEGNEHYVDDYSLPYQSLILQEYIEGQPGEAVNLNRIWDLVGDEAAFTEYVETELTAFLDQS